MNLWCLEGIEVGLRNWHATPHLDIGLIADRLLTIENFFSKEECAQHIACSEGDVLPKTGMALLFLRTFHHEGAIVPSWQKYVLRSDVMYGPEPKR